MKKFILVLFVFAFLKPAIGRPGTLGESFGKDGTIISETYLGSATAAVIRMDGKIIAAGAGYYDTIELLH